MSLVAILISLALEKLLPMMDGWRHYSWFEHYSRALRSRLGKHPHWHGIPTLLLILLLPVIGVAVAQALLTDILGFLGFVFAVVVLTYCLGPKDPHRLLHKYLDAAYSGDTDIADKTLAELLQGDVPEGKAERATALVNQILVQTHERLLGVLFWFIILGPMGAVLYRLTQEQRQCDAQTAPQQEEETADNGDAAFSAAIARLHFLLAWIPSHLAALSYAVMGSFVHALRAWHEEEPTTPEEAEEAGASAMPASHRMLLRIGYGSLQFDSNPPRSNSAVRETLGLCGRSLIAWITILALLTLAGWTS
jgi:membrane protein required for beta-lactamase induction